MSKYIDADELIKTLNREGVPFNEDVNHFILHAPAADVKEVRHGRWEKDSDTAFFWKCSECGAYLFWRKEEYLLRDTDEPNYCPNCGAKMDEKEAPDLPQEAYYNKGLLRWKMKDEVAE